MITPPVVPKRTTALPRKVSSHPMLAHQSYTAYVRPSVAFKYVTGQSQSADSSLATWDSPTDHIYSHAEEECSSRSSA